MKAWQTLKGGFVWEIGSSESYLWYDPWLPIGKLCQQVPFVQIPNTLLLLKDIWCKRVCNLDCLFTIIPDMVWDLFGQTSLGSLGAGMMVGLGKVLDYSGAWISGFSTSIPYCDVLKEEAMTILHGLQFAWSAGCRNVIYDTDSLIVFNLVMALTCHPRHSWCALFLGIQILLQRDWTVHFNHVLRAANLCDNYLTWCGTVSNKGCGHGLHLMMILIGCLRVMPRSVRLKLFFFFCNV